MQRSRRIVTSGLSKLSVGLLHGNLFAFAVGLWATLRQLSRMPQAGLITPASSDQ